MVLGWVKHLLSRPATQNDPQALRTLDVMAPRQQDSPSGADVDAPAAAVVTLICREPVLDRMQKIAGYQFRLRPSVTRRIRCSSEQVRRLYDRVMLDHLLALRLDRLLGGRFALLELDMASLQEPALEGLPLHQLILLLSPQQAPEPQQLQRLQWLRSRGMRVAWCHADPLAEQWSGLLPLVDVFLLDVAGQGGRALALLNPLFNRCPELQILARGLEAYDHFEACHRWQQQHYFIHWFQGGFVTRREAWSQPNIEPGRMGILQVLNQLRRGAELRTLAQSLRQDSVLVYKLLRYVNSPAGGLATPVSSIEHAVVILGREKLSRWLGVLLFSVSESSPRDMALLDTALIRARLMELMLEGRRSRADQEQGFLAGLFSLLDRLLRTSMQDVAQHLQLPEAVADALLQQQGWLAPWLAVVEGLEAGDETLEQQVAALSLSLDELNQWQMEAMVWAQEAQA